jgi:ankyrin repeat protein
MGPQEVDPNSDYWKSVVSRWERACVNGDINEVKRLVAEDTLKHMHSAVDLATMAPNTPVFGSFEHDPQPLNTACVYGQVEVVKILLAQGLDPRKNPMIHRQLFIALCTVPSGWEGRLCDATSSSNDNDQLSSEQLRWVLETGRPQVAKVLVDWGIDVDYTPKSGQPPLVMLARAGLVGVTKVFLDAGANPYLCSSQVPNMDAAFTAAATGGSLPILKEILARTGQYRYPLTHRNDRSETLLHAACDVDNREVIQYLLGIGMDINEATSDGTTPLHYASGKRTNLTSFLIKRGADIHAVEVRGRTALHDACTSGSLVSVDALVAAGADIHSLDKRQETPLTCAALRGRHDIVRRLISLGVDPALHEQVGPNPSVPPLMKSVIISVTARPHDKAETLGVLMKAQGLSPLDEIYGKPLMEHVKSESFWYPNSNFNGNALEVELAIKHVEDLQRAYRAELMSESLERAMGRDDEENLPSSAPSRSSGMSL